MTIDTRTIERPRTKTENRSSEMYTTVDQLVNGQSRSYLQYGPDKSTASTTLNGQRKSQAIFMHVL